MPTTEDLALLETQAEPVVVERRRAGRIDYSNPHLIDLLRRREFVEPVEPLALAEPLEFTGLAEPEPAQIFVVSPPAKTGSAATLYIVVTSLCFWAATAGALWASMSAMR